MDYNAPMQRDSWFAPLSVDLIVKVLKVTFLHPFICWIIPMCFRAQNYPWGHDKMVYSIVWATFITLCWAAGIINQRLAFGVPREVDLGEEVIVITGGASGLGLLIAEGASVAVLDINEMEHEESRGVTFYKCDVTDKDALAKVAAQIEEDLGTPTVLINNAAIVHGKPLLDMSFADVDRSLTTNLTAQFYSIKTFLPAMIRGDKGERFVLGHVGAARLSDYSAAKAGLTALHKSLTAELRATHPEIRTTPSSFLAPVVEPVDVTKEIIAAIDGGYSTHVKFPFYARWIDYYNILPLGFQQLARKLSGVDRAMDNFVGRQGISGLKKKA
ncbi:unnamed protein product [Parascedosporium putredinis]|uniref:NAD(P)-binding protein n=1 Tax=Parascedosporium putredinis TaxID=1442378 RepID=A0A9P1MBH7_9PEZI|nr:unnamed protein product [Parascedosporium putredinis]CAI7999586.1 unnamed protein product [Parascedosporium putredinis]